MVRYQQDVGAQARIAVHPYQVALAGGLDVAGEQRAAGGRADPQHTARTVAAVGAARRPGPARFDPVGARVQDLELDAVPCPALASRTRREAGIGREAMGGADRSEDALHADRIEH